MEIKIGTKGEIVNKKDEPRFIFIEDDRENTGGYYVYQSDDLEDAYHGYDTWIEDGKLEQFIQESGWKIKWFNK